VLKIYPKNEVNKSTYQVYRLEKIEEENGGRKRR